MAEAAFREAEGYEVELEKRRIRLEMIEIVGKIGAYDMVGEKDYEGRKVSRTRFVDVDDESRLVAEEFSTSATDRFFAKATTVGTVHVMDTLATRRRRSRLTLTLRVTFLHLLEDEVVLVEPPGEWK